MVNFYAMNNSEKEDLSIFEKIKRDHFADGVEITYPEDSNDLDCEYFITEYPDGRKVRQHVNDLNKG